MKNLRQLEKQRNKLNLQIGYLLKKKLGQKSYSKVKLNKALKRTYAVSTQSKGKDKISCRIHLPVCFRNKKVRVRLV